MRFSNGLAAIALAVFLVACAGSGSIKWDDVRQLRVGMTKAEVEQKMGKPYSVAAKSDGTEVWIWVHANGITGG